LGGEIRLISAPDVGSDDDAGVVDASMRVDAGDEDAGADAGDGGRRSRDGGHPPPVLDGGSGKMDREFGEACAGNSDCKSNICLSTFVCSYKCDSNGACPANNLSWTCTADGAQSSVCFCEPSEDGIDLCDGQDNDCDGTVDNDPATGMPSKCPGFQVCQSGGCVCPSGNICGLECVDKDTDVNHCGDCNTKCVDGETCEGGMCHCQGTHCTVRANPGDPNDMSMKIACIDIASDSNPCGGCESSFACTCQEDCSNSTCGPADHDWPHWVVRDIPSQYSTDTDGIVHDFNTGLVWESHPNFDFAYTHDDAAAHCAGLTTGGYIWRLPSKEELWSIVDYTRVASDSMPAADPSFYMPPGQTFFWASTVVAGDSTMAWFIDFSDGHDATNGIMSPLYTRCVASSTCN